MPTRDDVQRFLTNASNRMRIPIEAYYNAVERYGADSMQGRVAQSLAKTALERTLRQLHTEAGLLGAGGSLDDGARGVLNDIISTDLYYADNFADSLPKLSRAQALARSQMYLPTQLSTVNEIASLNVPTLPIYPQDERLICGHFCKCTLRIVYLFGQGNFNIYWDINPTAEHCDDCIRLAATWRPLKIRDGEIVQVKAISDADLRHIKALLAIALPEAA